MDYFMERALFYYFLLSEIVECGRKEFKFIAAKFGVSARQASTFAALCENDTLGALASLEEISTYEKYLEYFCTDAQEFGKDDREREIIGAKALALHKIYEMFGATLVKGNRLRKLSHVYQRGHTGAVLYALQLLLSGGKEETEEFALRLLERELKEGENSDAGLVLLNCLPDKAETLSYLTNTPDMLVRPKVTRALAKRYRWEEKRVPAPKKSMGF